MIKNMYTMLTYIFIILVIFCVMHVFYYNDQKIIFDNDDNIDNIENNNNNINNINNFLKEKFNVPIDLNSDADTTLYVNDLISLNDRLKNISTPIRTLSPSDQTEILNTRQSYLIQIQNLLTNLYTTRFADRTNELNAATYNAYNQYI